MYESDLLPGTAYSVRGRAKSSRGNSDYSDIIVATPQGIPTAPSNVQVNAVTGECLEVSLVSPVYGEPFKSYTAQWNYDPCFLMPKMIFWNYVRVTAMGAA